MAFFRSSRLYFPWKLSSHYVIRASIFTFSLIAIVFYVLHEYLERKLGNVPEHAVAYQDLQLALAKLAIGSVILSSIFILWAAWFYFRPLGRILRRTRDLRRSRRPQEEHLYEDIEAEDPGEWADLDRAVARLHNDLRIKTDQLGREREELSALISSVSNAILAIDVSEAPLFFNSQFADFFGVPETVSGEHRRLGEIFRSPDLLGAFRNVLKFGRPAQVLVTLHASQSSMTRIFNVSVAPLRETPESPAYGAVASFHDVTDLKQAEQIRIEFVGNASHELRTPLTSIKGYVATLQDDLKNGRKDDAAQFLQVISENVDRMIFLVSDLLDLSTIESGTGARKVLVHTREVTESVLKQLEEKRSEKKIQLNVQYHAETLIAEPRRVEQVVLNLVQNAIKYIPEGRRIDVKWSLLDDESVRLSVKDNGPGIPAEHQARLFERFYRVDPGRSRDQGGTGLGLSIVKHIMISHGGSVRLESRLGEGTEFICVFPATN